MILRMASFLVPADERAEWLAEWHAELHHIRLQRPELAIRFALGAFRDALWMRRNRPPCVIRLNSPAACIALLALAAATAILLALWLQPPQLKPLPVLVTMAISLLILPAVAVLTPGDYSASFRARRWGFLVLKAGLLLPIVYFGSLDLGVLLAPHMQAHGLIVGFVAGFRWILMDQRRRCPVCLRRLACPTLIGSSSHLLLGWYGTELICTRGHGLMHVPGIPASSYSAQRWVELDRSWKSLFDVPAS